MRYSGNAAENEHKEEKMTDNGSKIVWARSQKVFPGGVNSPVRAYRSVGREPIAIAEGTGPYIKDVDSNSYLDFVNSWGPLILGHADPDVAAAISKQAALGASFGAVTPYEVDLGEYIVNYISAIEKVRFVNSGTEAVMSALRLARGATGRDFVVKFEGCYHGHHDAMLVNAGSGLLTFSENISESSSPGVPESFSEKTIVLPLDNDSALRAAFDKKGDQIAAVIIEPLPANSGLLKQRLEFIELIRELTEKHGAVFILDEVISGFRLGFGGFAEKYKVKPDLTTYGKIIGGGLPVGAFGGKAELMDQLSPEGKVYQAGTLSGNPLAMVAGITTLRKLKEGDVYQKLDALGARLEALFQEKIVPACQGKPFAIDLIRENSIFWMNIHEAGSDPKEVRTVHDIWEGAPAVYGEIFRSLLNDGIHIAPSAYEVGFLSYPMEEKDIETMIGSLEAAVQKVGA